MTQSWRGYVPNSLTVVRFILAFTFPFIPEAWWISFIVLATLTEFFDGFLARRWNVVSQIGRQMDPVADKVFVLAVLLTLLNEQIFTWWQLGLIVARDLMVIVGGILAWVFGLGKDFLNVSPKYSGKIATALQFVLIVTTCWQLYAPLWLFYVTAFASLVAAGDYFVLGVCSLSRKYSSG